MPLDLPHNPKLIRSEIVTLRATPQSRALWDAAAARMERTRSDWAARTLDKAAKKILREPAISP